MNVLVAGCGDLGTEVGLRFAAAGDRVSGLRRTPGRLPAAIDGIAADLSNPLADLPSDIDVVVYAASADGRSEEAYRRAYVDGPRHLLDALEREGGGPHRMLFVSSTAVYGVDDGSEVDESTPTGPSSSTGAVLVEAEERLHARRPDATVFRLAGVYGPGRTRLIDQVRDGSAVIPASPTYTNRIHRDDAARAIVALMSLDIEPARLLLGVDHDPAERGEVLRFLADELGLPHPPGPSPHPPGPSPHPPGPSPRHTVGAGRRRGGNKRCRNAALLATGFTFAYPTYREGYRAVLAGEGERHP